MAVSAASDASGGYGGTGVTGGGAGGAATATASARGTTNVLSYADAVGGTGVSVAGAASATSTAKGATGSYQATASTALAIGSLVQSVWSQSGGGVDGTGTVKALATIGAAAAAFASTGQGVAQVTGAPTAAGPAAVLAANAAITSAFGAAPVFFAEGELGGAYSTGGKAAQTVTSIFSESVDLTQLAARQDLVVGLYGGVAVGTGVTAVQFDLLVDGTDVLSQTFASAGAAKTWFTNHAVDLGSLASGATLGADTLTVQATLSVTADASGSGFYAGILVGDPPGAAAFASPAAGRFTQLMAGLGASTPAVVGGAVLAERSLQSPLATARAAVA